jgi:hypothetical protein
MGLFSLSDEQAMCRVQQQNDPRAFALLVRQWERWTRCFCARMTGDAHIGEDPEFATVHVVTISGLSCETSYYFIAVAADPAGLQGGRAEDLKGRQGPIARLISKKSEMAVLR